jgi:hypothetical protein
MFLEAKIRKQAEQEYKVSVTHYDEEGIVEEYEVIQ